MAFVSEMFDQLRDLLNDATDTQVPFSTKKLFLNRGIALLWPLIGRVSTVSVDLTQGVRRYTLTSAVMDGRILSVEYTADGDNDDLIRLSNYDVLPGDEDQTGSLRLPFDPPSDAARVDITIFGPLPSIAAASYAAAGSEAWTGPDRAIHLPVLYAMSMIAARRIDDRQDHTRYSTTQAVNGVTDSDIMGASAMWLNQFYTELEQMSRPLPPARD